jgi:hypothetical protein
MERDEFYMNIETNQLFSTTIEAVQLTGVQSINFINLDTERTIAKNTTTLEFTGGQSTFDTFKSNQMACPILSTPTLVALNYSGQTIRVPSFTASGVSFTTLRCNTLSIL